MRLLFIPCLLFLPASLASPLNKPPQIVKDLRKQVELKEGSFNRFLLECGGDGSPPPSYQWYRNNEELSSDNLASHGVQIISNNQYSQLYFPSPTLDQQGYYYCEATNILGTARSSVSHLAPVFPPPAPQHSPPVFTITPKTELKSLGSRVVLSCQAEGTPEPSIVWTKNGEIIPVESGKSLIIPSLRQEDVANYACNASNIAGYEYKNVIVNILTEVARIREGPQEELVVSKGSNISLPCEAEGYPVPVITWTVDGREITKDAKYSLDAETGDLTVVDAAEDDEGEYRCRATNHGEDTAAGSVVVKSVTTIIEGPTDRTETVFSSIKMPCKVVADMTIELSVTWKKDNIDLDDDDDRMFKDKDNSLVINNITNTDFGTYTCVARNTLNTDTASGLLTVVGVKPEISTHHNIHHQVAGGEVSLVCEVVGGWPAPTVTWYKDSEIVDMERVLIEEDNTLKIIETNQADSGVYVCKADNSEGSASQASEVNIRSKSEIISPARQVEFLADSEVTLPCDYKVDSALLGGLEVAWYKDGENIEVIQAPEPPPVIGESSLTVPESASPCADYEGPGLYMLANSALTICSLREEDIGEYYCGITTDLEQSVTSQVSSVYMVTIFPWWIIIIILTILIILIILICVVCYCMRKKKGKGYYGMDLEDGGKHNKSDIYYTTEDAESIMNEMDDTNKDGQKEQGRTPIFTPKGVQRLDKSGGSIGSLLDDDFMDQGFDEDGSFRERYAE